MEIYCLKGSCFSLRLLGVVTSQTAGASLFSSGERVLCFAWNGGEDLEGSFNTRLF